MDSILKLLFNSIFYFIYLFLYAYALTFIVMTCALGDDIMWIFLTFM